MHLKDITKIFIIESPSKDDIVSGKREGVALSEMLTLARIQNSCFTVEDKDTLTKILGQIADEFRSRKMEWAAIYLHFSLHGNKEGVGLTNNEFIDWKEFHKTIKHFNEAIGYLQVSKFPKFAPINLHFSACEGFSATTIKDLGEESPYISLVGPTCAVDWADSLMAFSVYYHAIIHKKTGMRRGVEIMNLVNGFDNIFCI